MKTKDQHVEGEVPPHFLEQASYSSHASGSLCLDNQEQYSRIAHYMYSWGRYDCVPVAPDGSCLFSSLRRIIPAPFEYRNIHLRRQLVVMLVNHKAFFFNLLKEHIRGTYGFPRLSEEEYQQKYDNGLLTDQEVQDHNCPGPFSFHSYLSALLNPEMWGDEQVLCLCSMMWQIGLTVMSAETFTQIRFRHRSSLEKADGVLVMCLGQHYVPACKTTRSSIQGLLTSIHHLCHRFDHHFKSSHLYLLQLDAIDRHGSILQLDGYIIVPPN